MNRHQKSVLDAWFSIILCININKDSLSVDRIVITRSLISEEILKNMKMTNFYYLPSVLALIRYPLNVM